jgi:AcrR family transcriptional regulator
MPYARGSHAPKKPVKKRASKPVNRPVLRRQAKGLRTREAILARAVDIASAEGLEGLTVGSLAEQLGMSKSGLFAHFGSKEELQLATVEMARDVFINKVTLPAIAAPRGMPRLWSLIDHWLVLVEKRVFEGGCFFTAASFEFDGRRGVVRDRIAYHSRGPGSPKSRPPGPETRRHAPGLRVPRHRHWGALGASIA